MIVIKCDRCGKEKQQTDNYFPLFNFGKEDEEEYQSRLIIMRGTSIINLCEECQKDFDVFLNAKEANE